MSKLTIPEVQPVFDVYTQAFGMFGPLHIIFDGNISDEDIRLCLAESKKQKCKIGEELASMLIRLSKTQRKKMLAVYFTYKGEHYYG